MTEPLTLAQRLRSWDRCWPGNINIETAMDEAADELDRLRDANKALTVERDEWKHSSAEHAKWADQHAARAIDAENDRDRFIEGKVLAECHREAAEAKLAKALEDALRVGEQMLDQKFRADRLSAELAEARAEIERLTIMAAVRETEARNALHPFDKYVPDACFEGKGRYKMVETTEAGGGWLGAEDFRRARSFLASKEASHE